MKYHDKIQLTLIIAPPDQVAEGDRIFKSHRAWMEATHYRDGENESNAGVLDHFKQGNENWEDVQAFVKWLEKCKVTFVPAASIFNSLW